MPNGVLMSFALMSRTYGLPGWMFFRYAQLCHAARAQFPVPPHLQLDPLEDLLSSSDLEKPLSALYNTLLPREIPKMDRLWNAWKSDIPTLDREDWEACLEHGPKLVISAGDKLTQTKFLHRVYFTPAILSKIYPDRDPHCPRCQTQIGTYLHMFWDCPALSKFWLGVYDHLNIRMDLSVPKTPELALLGIHEDEHRSHHSKILISLLFYYAKKEILSRWTSASPPTLSSWENIINTALPLYRLTYISRGCPWKFDKVWLPWII